jgi:hypothetical protein
VPGTFQDFILALVFEFDRFQPGGGYQRTKATMAKRCPSMGTVIPQSIKDALDIENTNLPPPDIDYLAGRIPVSPGTP